MPSGYLPSVESELVTWLNDFYNNISANPAAYGLSADQVSQFDTARTQFLAVYEATTNPATRTPEKVELKRILKHTLLNAVRGLVNVLQAWPQMTDDKRRALGITVRAPASPVGPPRGVPGLGVAGVVGHRVAIELRGEDGRRRKPAGVAGANIYTFVGDRPPADVEGWKFEGATTRTTLEVEFPASLPPGTKLWLTATWFNPRMLSGSACPPVPTQVNYGGLATAA